MALAGCAPGQKNVFELLAPYQPEPLPEAPPGTSYLLIGERLLKAGEFERAQKAFLRSARAEGITAAAMNGAGVAAEALGRVGEARTYFETAVELDPESILARNNLGVALYKLGEYHNARAAFEAAFALSDGRNSVAELNLGLVGTKIARIEGTAAASTDADIEVVRQGSTVYMLRPSDIIPEQPGEG